MPHVLIFCYIFQLDDDEDDESSEEEDDEEDDDDEDMEGGCSSGCCLADTCEEEEQRLRDVQVEEDADGVDVHADAVDVHADRGDVYAAEVDKKATELDSSHAGDGAGVDNDVTDELVFSGSLPSSDNDVTAISERGTASSEEPSRRVDSGGLNAGSSGQSSVSVAGIDRQNSADGQHSCEQAAGDASPVDKVVTDNLDKTPADRDTVTKGED